MPTMTEAQMESYKPGYHLPCFRRHPNCCRQCYTRRSPFLMPAMGKIPLIVSQQNMLWVKTRLRY